MDDSAEAQPSINWADVGKSAGKTILGKGVFTDFVDFVVFLSILGQSCWNDEF